MAIVREKLGMEGSFRPLLALVAHQAKGDDLMALVRRHRAALRRCRVVTTQEHAQTVSAELAQPVNSAGSGPESYASLLRAVCAGRIDVIICLRDPSELAALDDGARLLRVCDLFEVVVASNVPSANIVLGFVADATRYLVRSRHPSAGNGVPWDPADRRNPFTRAR